MAVSARAQRRQRYAPVVFQLSDGHYCFLLPEWKTCYEPPLFTAMNVKSLWRSRENVVSAI